MKKKWISLAFSFAWLLLLQAQEMDFSKRIGTVEPHAKFRLDSFMVWCGSMVKGDDDRYYLFYSRWPRRLGHQAWATHSEVAVAVADKPDGPYTHLKVVLPKRDKRFWDADVTHNPTVHKFGNTYYLYYMGNYGNGEWWDHRNHQRIGLATAKSITGPWKRSAVPLVDTTTKGFDHMIASNPSVMKRLDGKYQMIYKGVEDGPKPFGGKVTHGAALADKPEGPFVKTSHRIFIKDTVKFAAEDPYIWAQDGKYWAIVKDMQGVFTNAGTSLALFESGDGFDWRLSKHALVSTTTIPWTTGAKKVQKLERPQLWIENGVPKILFCAVYDGSDNYNVAIPLAGAKKSSLIDDLDIGKMVQPVPMENRFIDTAYNIWCGSVIKAAKGKYYMFYSRWPKAEGHGAWITHSEIALAKADRPEGPYKHVKVVFKARGNQFWDGVCTHNPAAIVHNGKYYLYYMGATGTAAIKRGFDYSPAWYNYRNNQRIGVAVADDPEGEWTRFDKPVLDVSKDSAAYDAIMVSNPAITVDQNGRAILVYKQVERNGTYRGGRVRYGVAFSKSLMGPFAKHPDPIFEDKQNPNDKEWMIAEDPFIWNQKGTNYAIVRDVVGKFTGSSGGLALFSSKDGIAWSPAKNPKVLSKEVYAADGTRFDDKLERPCLLLENGVPTYLFGAMGIDKRKHSMNVAVPLKWQDDLERNFIHPPIQSRPYVWWHWMGSNFSKEGITKDLESMKEMGIGGATIFNIASAVQETHFPILNNPWPTQTYRSPAYWDAMRHAAAEAKRLGLEIGLHNTAGYSTTGGPWITEEKGMQRTVLSTVEVEGGKPLKLQLVKPEPPIFQGWGSPKIKASFYKDIAVLAIPSKPSISTTDIIDVSNKMNSDGELEWTPPAGKWTIYRYGHAPTMANPHPLPDDIIGKTLEVDKMSAEQNAFHWKTVLDPLKEHVGDYFGSSFKHLLIDSYEADFQNWTPAFRDEFIKRKGYDPVPWLPVFEKDKLGKFTVVNSEEQTARFKWDFNDVVNRLFFENGWNKGKEMMKQLGLQLQFEPYWGPFDIVEGAALADIPMGEFWTHRGGIQAQIPPAARAAGKTIIGAEAFTGRPESSQYTEDPAFLKPTTVEAFAAGVNRLILHTWVHQPFDDKYQPGMSMGWWGTHFGRHQTWAKPGKAYFDFIGRAQSLLQYGETSSDYVCLEKPEGQRSDVISTHDFLLQNIQVEEGKIVLPSGRTYPFLYLPNGISVLPEVMTKIQALVAAGAVVAGAKPMKSASLQGYPNCDTIVASIANKLWSGAGTKQFGKGFVYADLKTALQRINIISPVTIESSDSLNAISSLHRHGKDADVFLLANLKHGPQAVTVSFAITDKQPELWQAEDGTIMDAPVWRVENGRTLVQLFLKDYQSVFVVFRKPIRATATHATKMQIESGKGSLAFSSTQSGKPLLVASTKAVLSLYQNNILRKINMPTPSTIKLEGPWQLQFQPKLNTPFDTTLAALGDFSFSADSRIKYFSGTVKYLKEYSFSASQLNGEKRVFLDLGVLHDIVQLKVNGKAVGVGWYPPYEFDITELLHVGSNKFELEVTNNWANRLIGDEQAPADFEWGADRGNMGRAMKAFPDWFIQNQPRQSPERKAFLLWYYYRKDSQLKPAGLVGPVQLVFKSFKQL